MNELSTFKCAVHRLATTFLSKALLEPALFARLQVEAVLLDVLADTFTLDLSTKTTKGLFKRLILSNGDQNQGELLGRLQGEPENCDQRR